MSSPSKYKELFPRRNLPKVKIIRRNVSPIMMKLHDLDNPGARRSTSQLIRTKRPITYFHISGAVPKIQKSYFDRRFRAPVSLLQRGVRSSATKLFAVSPSSSDGEKESPKKTNIFQKIKKFGLPRVISWVFWRIMFKFLALCYGPLKFLMVTGRLPNLMMASDIYMISKYTLTFMSLTFLLSPLRAVLTMFTTRWIISNPWFLENIGDKIK